MSFFDKMKWVLYNGMGEILASFRENMEGENREPKYKSGDAEAGSELKKIEKMITGVNNDEKGGILLIIKNIKTKLENKKEDVQVLSRINYKKILDCYKGERTSDGTEIGPLKLSRFLNVINYLEGYEDSTFDEGTKAEFEGFRKTWEAIKNGRSPDDFVNEWLNKEKERDKSIKIRILLRNRYFGKGEKNIDDTRRMYQTLALWLEAIKNNTQELGSIYVKLQDDSMSEDDWRVLDKFVEKNKESLSMGTIISSSGKEREDTKNTSKQLNIVNRLRLVGRIAAKPEYDLEYTLDSDLRSILLDLDVNNQSQIDEIKNIDKYKGYEKFIDECVDVIGKREKMDNQLQESIEKILSEKGYSSIDRKGGLEDLYRHISRKYRDDMNDHVLSGKVFDISIENTYKEWEKNRIKELKNINLGDYAYKVAFYGKENVNITSLNGAEIGDVKLSKYSRNEYIIATILRYKETKSQDALQALGYFAQRAYPGKEKNIKIGQRGEGIASFLCCLKKEEKFSEYATEIESVLNQYYPSGNYPEWDGYSSTEDAERETIEAYEAGIEALQKIGVTFDSQEVQRALYGVRPHARPGLSPYFNQVPRTPEEYQTKHRFDFISQNTEKRFITSVKDLSDDRVESIIPEEEYLYGIKLKGKLENQGGGLIDFLGNCKDLPDIYKRSPGNIILAKAIMNSKNTSLSIEGVDQSLLDQIKADWFDWGCKGLIESYKRHLGIHINFFAGETALGVREGMLNSILKGKMHFEVKDIPNPHPDKIDRDIFYFTDTGNSAYRENPYYPVYGFNPKTGEIFIEKQGINKEAGKISLGEGGVMREKIADIPPYSIFMGRISVNDILPNTRPSSYEESVENLADEISNKMAFAFSEVKGKEIEENLLQSRYKGEILDKAKTLLGITEDTEEIMEDQLAKYQLLTTIVNTMENISSEDMNQLNIFLDNIKQYYGKNEGMQNMTSNPSIFSYFSMYANSSDLSKEGWESESFEKNRVFREGSGKTSLKPSETKLGRFFSFLYKRKGENPNFNNIDPTLTSDLITKDNLEMRMLDIGKIRYLNQNMSKDIGNISGTTQLEQWGKYMKKTLYAPYELDAIETEIQGIPD